MGTFSLFLHFEIHCWSPVASQVPSSSSAGDSSKDASVLTVLAQAVGSETHQHREYGY